MTCTTQHMLLQNANIKLTWDLWDAPAFLLRKERLVYSLIRGVSQYFCWVLFLHSEYFLEFCYVIVLFQLSFGSVLSEYFGMRMEKREKSEIEYKPWTCWKPYEQCNKHQHLSLYIDWLWILFNQKLYLYKECIACVILVWYILVVSMIYSL